MADVSSQTLEVQKFLRSIGMSVGTQDGVADDNFKKGVLDSLTVLHRSLSHDPKAEIKDLSPATVAMLKKEIAEFKAGSEYKSLDDLVNSRFGPDGLNLSGFTLLAANGIDSAQKALGMSDSARVKALVEGAGSPEQKGRFKYYNWTATTPADQLVEKPVSVQASTKEVLAIIDNSDKIFNDLNTIYPDSAPAAPAVDPAFLAQDYDHFMGALKDYVNAPAVPTAQQVSQVDAWMAQGKFDSLNGDQVSDLHTAINTFYLKAGQPTLEQRMSMAMTEEEGIGMPETFLDADVDEFTKLLAQTEVPVRARQLDIAAMWMQAHKDEPLEPAQFTALNQALDSFYSKAGQTNLYAVTPGSAVNAVPSALGPVMPKTFLDHSIDEVTQKISAMSVAPVTADEYQTMKEDLEMWNLYHAVDYDDYTDEQLDNLMQAQNAFYGRIGLASPQDPTSADRAAFLKLDVDHFTEVLVEQTKPGNVIDQSHLDDVQAWLGKNKGIEITPAQVGPLNSAMEGFYAKAGQPVPVHFEVVEAKVASQPAAPTLTTEAASQYVEGVLGVLSATINTEMPAALKREAAEAGKQGGMGSLPITVHVDAPGAADGTFDAQSQQSLQSVLQVLRSARGMDIPGGETWKYTPEVGAQMLHKLPEFKAKLPPEQQQKFDLLFIGKDGKPDGGASFIEALNVLDQNKKLSDHLTLDHSPVQLNGIFGQIFSWAMKFIGEAFPQAIPFIDNLVREKTGFGVNELLPKNDFVKIVDDVRNGLPPDSNERLQSLYKTSLTGVTDLDKFNSKMKTGVEALSLIPIGSAEQRQSYNKAVGNALDAARAKFGDLKPGETLDPAKVDLAAKTFANVMISEVNNIPGYEHQTYQPTTKPELDKVSLGQFEDSTKIPADMVIGVFNMNSVYHPDTQVSDPVLFKTEDGRAFIAGKESNVFTVQELKTADMLADIEKFGIRSKLQSDGAAVNAATEAKMTEKYGVAYTMLGGDLDDKYEFLRKQGAIPGFDQIAVEYKAAQAFKGLNFSDEQHQQQSLEGFYKNNLAGMTAASFADGGRGIFREYAETKGLTGVQENMMVEILGKSLAEAKAKLGDAKPGTPEYETKLNEASKAFAQTMVSETKHYDYEHGTRRAAPAEQKTAPVAAAAPALQKGELRAGFNAASLVYDRDMMKRLNKEPVVGYDKKTDTVHVTYLDRNTGQAYGRIDVTNELRGNGPTPTLDALRANYKQFDDRADLNRFFEKKIGEVLKQTDHIPDTSRKYHGIIGFFRNGHHDIRDHLANPVTGQDVSQQYQARAPKLFGDDRTAQFKENAHDIVSGSPEHPVHDNTATLVNTINVAP